MRQGNGSDLLGANDPRSASIGIIYVAPNDDRKTVLAAILTQEKLGRKQVAIVLSNPNKAFQRPVDFDDLKQHRKKLQAQLVIIAPAGPGPAEFARQRRFPVYTSLQNYAEALRDQQNLAAPTGDDNAEGGRRLRFFGGGRKANEARAVPVAQEDEHDIKTPQTAPLPQEQRDNRGRTDVLAAGAAGAAAGLLGAAAFSHHDDEDHEDTLPVAQRGNVQSFGNFDEDEDEDELPPLPLATPQPSPTEEPDKTPIARRGTSMPSAPLATPIEEDAEPVDDKDADGPGPGIIELPMRQGNRGSGKLPTTPPATVPNPDSTLIQQRPSQPRRNTGKMAAAAGAGAAGLALGAGAAAAAGSRAASTPAGASSATPAAAGGASAASIAQTGQGGTPPPTRNVPPGGRGGGPGQRRRGALPLLVILVILILLTAIIGGSVLAFSPGLFKNVTTSISHIGSPSATINITPAQQTVQNSYVLNGVNGNADPAQRQVKVRTINTQSQPISKQVNTTGHTKTAGAVARGQLTFKNGHNTPFTVGTQTAFRVNGISFYLDKPAPIPAADINNGTFGSYTASAHASTTGTAGNIVAGTLNGSCCDGTNSVFVQNKTDFTGGVDPQDYNYVTQADVSNALAQVKPQADKQATSAVTAKLAAGEKLAGNSQCDSKYTQDNPTGPKGVNYSTVTITATATCTNVAYDDKGAQSLVTQLLTEKAKQSPGDGYQLVGNIQTSTQVQNTNPVSLVANAKGVWAYQVTDNDKQNYINLIKGKTPAEAKTILTSQRGIGDVTIQFNGDKLPTDPNQITINILPVNSSNGGGTNGGSATPGSTPPAGTTPGASTPVNGRGSATEAPRGS